MDSSIGTGTEPGMRVLNLAPSQNGLMGPIKLRMEYLGGTELAWTKPNSKGALRNREYSTIRARHKNKQLTIIKQVEKFSNDFLTELNKIRTS